MGKDQEQKRLSREKENIGESISIQKTAGRDKTSYLRNKLMKGSVQDQKNRILGRYVSLNMDADGIVHKSALDAVGGTVVKLEANGPEYRPSEDKIAETITYTIADMPEIEESVKRVSLQKGHQIGNSTYLPFPRC